MKRINTLRVIILSLALAGSCATLLSEVRPPRPGFNLFSVGQDVQLGREARAEIERRKTVVHDDEVTRYLSGIGLRLAESRYAGHWRYSFSILADKSVNAFSLPGGPIYVNTGLFSMTQNEAQLAGVLAHEISHIALRHSTNQVTKANLLRVPALLAAQMFGGGLLGLLAQVGIGIGADSLLLSFSRGAEEEADYNGALIMADAGYNPVEMARFFERLHSQTGSQSLLAQFLSDHPDPGNRVRSVEELVRQLPPRRYSTDTGEFPRIRDRLTHPAQRFLQLRGAGFTIGYPDGWKQKAPAHPGEVVIAAADDRIRVQIGRDKPLVTVGAKIEHERRITVGSRPAVLATLRTPSRIDILVTVTRPQGPLYIVFTAPPNQYASVESLFEQMLRSVAFTP